MVKINKIFVVLFLVFALLFVFGCTQVDDTQLPMGDDFEIVNGVNQEIIDTIDDDSSVIDEGLLDVVARVNGDEILRGEVLSFQQMFTQQGQQVSEQEILEQLINQKVVYQQAIAQGFDVTDQEAEMEIESQLAQQGVTLDEFKEQLEIQGASYEDQLNSIKRQISIQDYLSYELSEEQIEISDEDVQEYYDQYVLEYGEEALPLEEIEMQIRMVLQQDKEQEIVEALVQELVSNAIIEYN